MRSLAGVGLLQTFLCQGLDIQQPVEKNHHQVEATYCLKLVVDFIGLMYVCHQAASSLLALSSSIKPVGFIKPAADLLQLEHP